MKNIGSSVSCILAFSFFSFAFSLSSFAFGPGGWQPGGGGWQPGGGNQPDAPGGGGGQSGGGDPSSGGNSFVFDSFITDSTGVGVDVRNGIWISTDRATAHIASDSNLLVIVVGAAAGSTALTNVDLRASTALGEIPSCAFAGCENLTSVILPSSVTNVAADAFVGCPKFGSVSYGGEDEPEEPDEPESIPEPQTIGFESELIEATEGNSLIVRVKGGCTNAAASVKLCLSYQTAAASDLNLAKGSVDGVLKKLTFPIVLTWDSGDVSTHEISIPVKTDSGKEVDEQLTFQLASATGCDLGGTSVCTALLHDAKGRSTSALPLAYGLAEPADAGRVAGATRKASGKTVTLSATANSGYVFIGWYDGETCLSQTTGLKFAMPAEDVRYTARFVTKAEDAAAISCALDGRSLSSDESLSISNACGVRLSYPIAAAGLSKVTVSASGLPAGLKLVCDKATGAYSVAGIPTAVSKTNSRTGLVTPSASKFTVTSSGKSKRTFVVEWTIGALPGSAAGTWNGVAETVGKDETAVPEGNFTLTASAAGSVSAKAVTSGGTASFSGKGWIEDDDGILRMAMTNKTHDVLCVQLDPQTAWTEDSISATIAGGKFGDGILEISAYRNPYGKTGKAVENDDAQNALRTVVGAWPVSVNGPDGETLTGTAKILGTGRITVTGKLSDGKTSYSMSGVLEVRGRDAALIPSVRVVGVTRNGCLWCDEEVPK